MKKLNSQPTLRKCKSSGSLEFSTCNQRLRKSAMVSLAKENQNYWHFQFYNNILEVNLIKKSKSSETFSSDSNTSEFSLLPTPETPRHPREILQKSLMKLKNSQWNDSVVALRNIVQISRFNPQLLEKCVPDICKGTTVLLRTLRSKATRTACQAANELFMNIKTFQGPEFEEMVHTLLQKSGHTNKGIRKDVLEALDSMVIHLPPVQSVKILLHRRIASYNLNARIIATKLLVCVFSTTGKDLATTLNEDSKIRLVQATIKFLQDESNAIKFHGMHLVNMLMQQKGFENIFQTKVNLSILNKTLKYIKNCFTE